MNKKCSKIKGFTLVELLIVIGILSIVIAGAYNLFFFGNKTYKASSEQYDRQSIIRIAMDRIVKDVRYARDLELLDNSVKDEEWESKLDNKYSYVYISEDGKSIKYKKEGFDTPIVVAGNYDGDMEYTLSFKDLGNNNLQINIGVEDNGKTYNVSSSEAILNIHLGDNKKITPEKAESITGIKFKKSGVVVSGGTDDDAEEPDDPNPSENYRDLKIRYVWDDSVYKNNQFYYNVTVIFNKEIKNCSRCKYVIKYIDGRKVEHDIKNNGYVTPPNYKTMQIGIPISLFPKYPTNPSDIAVRETIEFTVVYNKGPREVSKDFVLIVY